MQGYKWLLSLEDTVYFNYSKHESVKDMGKIGKGKQVMVMHHSLITTCEGLPLGSLAQKIWTRGPEPVKKQRQLDPIEEKESYKWLEIVNETEKRKPAHVNLVHVGDREADIYEHLHKMQGSKQFYLTRARSPREIANANSDTPADYILTLPVAGHYDVNVAKQKGELPTRQATITVRYGQVEIKPSEHLLRRDPTLKHLMCWVIYAVEENPPEGVDALSWVLLTNVATDSYQDALCRINWYKLRWIIEVYHKVMKSGCLVEDCRLERAKRIACYLALNSVIAWRLLWIKYMNNLAPEEKCTRILTTLEYRILYNKIHRKKKMPNRIAQLGGFLARRHDGGQV